MIFDRFANLKYKYGNRHFWCRGYFVDTVERNKTAIQKYIQNQLSEDKIADQISMKEFIDPFTGMPEHMFFNDYVLEQKGKVDFKTNVMASAEIGWRLGHIDNSTGFDVPKPKTLYRIGLFADYGIFDVHYRSNKPAVVLPETFNAENMTSDMAVNDILSTSQAQKIVNNLLVGVKFTVLFQLPEPKKCVFCNDDYTYLYR